MMNPTMIDHPNPTSAQLCAFLSEYSTWLLGAGATCIRLEKNVNRIASAYGKKIDMTIMPRHIHITIMDIDTEESVTTISTVHTSAINYTINTELSELSWAIADKRIDFNTAIRKFRHTVGSSHQSKWQVLLMVAFANAAFCRLFGGDFIAMSIVWIATLIGYYIKLILVDNHTDTRVMFLICSFVSSVLGATDHLFTIGTTPAIALGTSVLYLVPGIPLLNSFSDMLYRHYLCALSRFTDAMVLICCLSIGLCAAMLLMNASMFQ